MNGSATERRAAACAGRSGPGFAFGRFRDGDREFLGVVSGSTVIPVGAVLAAHGDDAGFGDSVGLEDLLAGWEGHVQTIAAAISDSVIRTHGLALSALTRLAPVAPRQLFLAGMNYRSHVVQLLVDEGAGSRPGMTSEEIHAEAVTLMDQRAASGVPFVFNGPISAVVGPDDDIRLRGDSSRNDWELELAAVISRPAHHVSRDDALSYVAGWTIVNDITCRDLIPRRDAGPIGADWLRAKFSPTFKPTGPYLVPSAFVDDPQQLSITLRLNGEVMQQASTGDMVFDVATLIAYCSEQALLLPGDLVLTGSPAGNGTHHGRFLTPGDRLEGEITGLGVQRNHCVAAGEPRPADVSA